jgi:hypothetical protein
MGGQASVPKLSISKLTVTGHAPTNRVAITLLMIFDVGPFVG